MYDVLAKRLFIKIFLCVSSLVPLGLNTKDEPRMNLRTPKVKKCLFIKIRLSKKVSTNPKKVDCLPKKVD